MKQERLGTINVHVVIDSEFAHGFCDRAFAFDKDDCDVVSYELDVGHCLVIQMGCFEAELVFVEKCSLVYVFTSENSSLAVHEKESLAFIFFAFFCFLGCIGSHVELIAHERCAEELFVLFEGIQDIASFLDLIVG